MSMKTPPRARILLVDDDRNLLESMGDWLRSKGFGVDEAASCESARLAFQKERFDLALVDLRLGDGDGFDVLSEMRKSCPETPVILMTGYGTVDTAIEVIRAGAFDLLTKPLIDQELEMAIDRALRQKRVLEENHTLRAQLDERFGLDNIVGSDPRMSRLFEVIQSVADTRATILITGESGTGKSLIARAIHRLSHRRDAPFVEVACGALPETLLESELFGHVAGSFTGATGNKIGKFKQADGGTLFLDEIGTASPSLQVKLLRVLQELQFEPVGGTETLTVDTRVVLATNEDLEAEVAKGRFRQDLFYRINVINLELPPLRERISDIPSLADHFLRQVTKETGKPIDGFDSSTMAAMQQYHWPGNVRELQNVVERAVLLGRGRQIEVADLPSHLSRGVEHTVSHSSARTLTLREALEGPERQIILQSLKEHGWNRNATAESLGINRTTLYKKMKRLGLECPAGAF
ncbi:MAG: sigma-54-dependent Fis family transcriptional regulator [Planctomycetales bacterium]|nr:sigma-54-dependent Fis family transcriptional regulator [Planctomycetales bacterium]